ncbi:uncharacterized protein LOC124930994 [Impatiens glandulifera]|uniref:uncharacterized protein LOC124930994 n=1 Tax=Impatiens glandulifera TaxID=253017 RepID=UPI001FB0C15E|nr:uncharacterized protein LOC124930994 [Impatiens glandulifera]
MDFWQKARNFAEEAAKKSQELTMEAAKRSQELTIGSSKFSDIVSEASKRSKEIAAEASKRADQIKSEASKRAEQIKSEAIKRADMIKSQLPSAAVLSSFVDSSSSSSSSSLSSPAVESEEDLKKDLEKFGITDELREFVKGITMNTFRDFPLEDDSEMANTPTLSNIRQDLSKWQEKHAKLVLSAVKEISKLRYELCPRIMKERKFWRIYFILVGSHVSPYEKRHINEEEEKEKEAAKSVEEVKHEEEAKGSSKAEPDGVNQKSKRTTSIDQDLDVFLLGDDVGDSDGGTGSADKDFDDDFDKL